jgi:hypothetical protein
MMRCSCGLRAVSFHASPSRRQRDDNDFWLTKGKLPHQPQIR